MKVANIMRWGVIVSAVCGLLTGFGGLTLASQSGGNWVPFAATQVIAVYNLSGGGRVLNNERTGPYVRDSNGSIYSRTVFVSGSAAGRTGPATLQDRKTGIVYKIDYNAQQVVIVSQPPSSAAWSLPSPPTEASFHAQYSPDQFLGTKVVNGIECKGWRARGPLTGEAWKAPSLNYADVQLTLVDSSKHLEFDMSLENIQVGQNPDPSLFKVPAGFVVLNR